MKRMVITKIIAIIIAIVCANCGGVETPVVETQPRKLKTFCLDLDTKVIHSTKCPEGTKIPFDDMAIFWGTEEEARSLKDYTWCIYCDIK